MVPAPPNVSAVAQGFNLWVRKTFFPKAQRQIDKAKTQNFAELDKMPDWFELLSLFVVLVNTCVMAAADPTATKTEEVVFDYFDYFFVSFFTIELTLRVIAFGLNETFKSGWNILDLFIVALGIIGLVAKLVFPQVSSSISSLSSIRIIRPLKAITTVTDVKIVLSMLSSCISAIVDIAALYLLFWLAGAAWGISLFKGEMGFHCVREELFNRTLLEVTLNDTATIVGQVAEMDVPPFIVANDTITLEIAYGLLSLLNETDYICGGRFETVLLGVEPGWCDDTIACEPLETARDEVAANRGFICPAEYRCARMGNPKYGFMHFDSFPYALLTTQILVTFEAWSDISLVTTATTNKFAIFYSFLVVLVGALFLTNLLVAVLTMEFDKASDETKAQRAAESAARRASNRRRIRSRDLVERINGYIDTILLAQHIRRQLCAIWDLMSDPDRDMLLRQLAWSKSKQTPRNNVKISVLAPVPPNQESAPSSPKTFRPGHTSLTVGSPGFGLLERPLLTFDDAPSSPTAAATPIRGSVSTSRRRRRERNWSFESNTTLFEAARMWHKCAGDFAKAGEVLPLIHMVPNTVALRGVPPIKIEFDGIGNVVDDERHVLKFMDQLTAICVAIANGLWAAIERPAMTAVSDDIEMGSVRILPVALQAGDWDPLDDHLPADQAKEELAWNSTIENAIHDPSFRDYILFEADAEEALHQIQSQGDYFSKVLDTPPSFLERLRFKIERFMNDKPYFEIATLLLTVIGTLAQLIQYEGMPQEMADALNKDLVFAFAILYTLEWVVRLAAVHPVSFLRCPPNYILLATAAGEWAASFTGDKEYTSLRSLRLVCVGSTLRFFPSTFKWYSVLKGSFQSSVVVVLLIAADSLIVALVGLQTLGATFCGTELESDTQPYSLEAMLAPVVTVGSAMPWSADCPGNPRANFDTFGEAILTAFQLIAADSWHNFMFLAMRVMDSDFKRGLMAVLFTVHYFGAVMILVNVFVAILIGATDPLYDEDVPEDESDRSSDEKGKRNVFRRFWTSVVSCCKSKVNTPPPEAQDTESDPLDATQTSNSTAMELKEFERRKARRALTAKVVEEMERVDYINLVGQEDFRETSFQMHMQKPPPGLHWAWQRWVRSMRVLLAITPRITFIKEIAEDLFESYSWQLLDQCAVLAAVAMLFLDDSSLAPDVWMRQTLRTINSALSIFFASEVAIQMVFRGPLRYFYAHPFLHAIDFLLALVGLIEFPLYVYYRISITYMKIGYLLRTFKLLLRAETIALILLSVWGAAVPLRKIFVIVVVVLGGFCGAGIILFSGKFGACEDETITTKAACLSTGSAWITPKNNFDSVPDAIKSLGLIMALEGWADIMYQGMDSTSYQEAPEKGHSYHYALYFVLFVFIGNFFLVNLFTSVLIHTFEIQKYAYRELRSRFQDPSLRWKLLSRSAVESIPVEPFLEMSLAMIWKMPKQIQSRLLIHKIRRSGWYGYYIVFWTLVGLGTGFAEYYPATELHYAILDYINDAVAAVFVIDAAAGLYSLGLHMFTSSPVNRFDLLAAIFLAIDTPMRRVYPAFQIGNPVRFVRLFRVLRSGRFEKRMREMMGRLGRAMASLIIIASFLGVFVLLSSLCAYKLFGRLSRVDGGLSPYKNFETLPNAIILCSTVLVGSDWSGAMEAASVSGSECNPQLGDCGYPVIAPILFFAFYIIGNSCLFNIFVATIIDSYDTKVVPDSVSEREVAEFVDAWREIDKDRTFRIKASQMLQLLQSLPDSHPFKPKPNEFGDRRVLKYEYVRLAKSLHIYETKEGEVELLKVLMELTRVVAKEPYTATTYATTYNSLTRKIDLVNVASAARRDLASGEAHGDSDDHEVTSARQLWERIWFQVFSEHYRTNRNSFLAKCAGLRELKALRQARLLKDQQRVRQEAMVREAKARSAIPLHFDPYFNDTVAAKRERFYRAPAMPPSQAEAFYAAPTPEVSSRIQPTSPLADLFDIEPLPSPARSFLPGTRRHLRPGPFDGAAELPLPLVHHLAANSATLTSEELRIVENHLLRSHATNAGGLPGKLTGRVTRVPLGSSRQSKSKK